MNAAQTELFDEALLRVLDANRTRRGLGYAAIGHWMAMHGFPSPDLNVVKDRVEVLLLKKFVEEVGKELGAANRAFRLTEAGLQYVNDRTTSEVK